MPYIRRLNNGRWQAVVPLPNGKRRSATLNTRSEAQHWGDTVQDVAHRSAQDAPETTLTWSPEGLTVFVPEDLITMDMAAELQQAIHRVLGERQPNGGG
jgi:hypothetical protein